MDKDENEESVKMIKERNMTASSLLDCQSKSPTLERNIAPLIEPEIEASSQKLPRNLMMINI